MFYNLKSPWSDNVDGAKKLLNEWLDILGIATSSDHEVFAKVEGKMLVIPHQSWVYNGFSGSSIPSCVSVDYANVTVGLVNPAQLEDLFNNHYQANNVTVKLKGLTHYGSEYSLCGISLCLEDSHITQRLEEVDCPHCMTEVMFRIQPENMLPV